MMRSRSTLGIALVTILAAGCGPDQSSFPGTEPSSSGGPLIVISPINAYCTIATDAQITNQINTLFQGGGWPDANSALSKFATINSLLAANNGLEAKRKTFDLVKFILKKFEKLSTAQKAALDAQTKQLVEDLYCKVGLSGAVFDLKPGDPAKAFVSEENNAGVWFPPNVVQEGTLITITEIPNGNPLITPLDKYPTYLEIEKYPDLPLNLANGKPVVGVCFPGNTPSAIAERLLLGHQRIDPLEVDQGFELLAKQTIPSALTLLLACPNINALGPEAAPTTWLGRLATRVAAFVLPSKVQAAPMMFAFGGVGGSPEEFSPFGAVDPRLSAFGGAGGSPEEFAPSMNPMMFSLPLGSIEGNILTSTTTGLPTVTVKTGLGTPIPGVTVIFSTQPATTPAFQPPGAASVCRGGTPKDTVQVLTDAYGQATLPCLAFGATVGYSNVKATFNTSSLNFPGAQFVTVGNPLDPTEFNYLVWSKSDPAPDWAASGYRYLLTTENGGPGGFAAASFDDSGWSLGNAPFGGGPSPYDSCTLFNTTAPPATNWPIGNTSPGGASDLLVRKRFSMQAAGQVSVQVAIDNDVQVFLNGVDISGGLKLHEGCATRPPLNDPFTFYGAAQAGDNVIAIRARDRGAIGYLDIRVAPAAVIQ